MITQSNETNQLNSNIGMNSDEYLEMIKEKWQKEQLYIAAQVIINADPPPSTFPDWIKHQNNKIDSLSMSPHQPCDSSYLFLPIQNPSSSNQILGGVDVSFPPPFSSDNEQHNQADICNKNKESDAIAVYVLYQNGKIIHQNNLQFILDLPYIPSYLAMRELLPIQQLIQKTEKDLTQQKQEEDENATIPIADVILVDGNGIMHERSAGIATCLGVTLNRKTIGVGKTLYCFDGLTREGVNDGIERRVRDFLIWCRQIENESAMEVNHHQRDFVVMCKRPIYAGGDNYGIELQKKNKDDEHIVSLTDAIKELSKYCKGFAIPLKGESGKIWGAALLGHGGKHTTGIGTKVPIYISIGHNISLEEAVRICAGVSHTRIPEPIRQADLVGREWMRVRYSSSKHDVVKNE